MSSLRHVSAVLVLLAVVGCGRGSAEPGDAGATGEPTVAASEEAPSVDPDETCSALLSDDVLAPLGWAGLTGPGESAGRCERTSATNTITVGRRPDLASGDDADEARAAYDQACVDLRRDDSLSPDTETTWLGEEVDACFRPFPKGEESGFAEMVMLTDEAQVVEVQVAAGEPTPEADVQAMLGRLVGAVLQAW